MLDTPDTILDRLSQRVRVATAREQLLLCLAKGVTRIAQSRNITSLRAHELVDRPRRD